MKLSHPVYLAAWVCVIPLCFIAAYLFREASTDVILGIALAPVIALPFFIGFASSGAIPELRDCWGIVKGGRISKKYVALMFFVFVIGPIMATDLGGLLISWAVRSAVGPR